MASQSFPARRRENKVTIFKIPGHAPGILTSNRASVRLWRARSPMQVLIVSSLLETIACRKGFFDTLKADLTSRSACFSMTKWGSRSCPPSEASRFSPAVYRTSARKSSAASSARSCFGGLGASPTNNFADQNAECVSLCIAGHLLLPHFSPLPYYNLNKTLWPTLKDFLRKNLIFLERSSEHFLYALYLFGNSYIIKIIDCIGTEEQHGRDQRFYLDTGGILPLGWIGTVSQPILRRWSYSRCVPVRARMCDPGGCGKAV